ncbi:glycosyl transferase [Candidatus Vallotia tarda]|uniref:UDP-N-acetylmuramyl pentapeptide phosphotransferase/UDP-N-acetylglucosamine-1-phosphate transferase,delete gene name n=1 Tax=Candidatus Vallotiella hemipterorum TaxID=1177213 RepID=A0A916JRI5_9BURK|nr:glycosyl transferase [Candidatus Vallotia tarda]CAG7597728.1 UDP-N-acetylmuramyl pentapeptide phosphotransferase/UDP-N-acetylglucosamine-1-phosphate transferase,delete gene name [Candidatus Vallotia tarda]
MQILNLYGSGACLFLATIAFSSVSMVLAFLLQTGLAQYLATDIPNERTLHFKPTPRIGGLGIIPVVVVLIWFAIPTFRLIALAALLLAALSQIDDCQGLSARIRFAGHLVTVSALVVIYRAPMPGLILIAIVFLLAWAVNLYNFMDGADGLAGGMTLLGFSGYAVGALISEQSDVQLAMACSAVAGAAAGFLLFNFHPAKIFLGDTGAIPLGFLAGAFGYLGCKGGVWPVWFPVLIFSPFIGDASVTLIQRVVRRKLFWLPHREHYYQRMVRYGLGHAITALIWYCVTAAGIIFSVIALRFDPMYQWIIVISWMLVIIMIGIKIDKRWQSYTSKSSH